ncbi:MAG: phospho-sugar mutase [Myxococcota bacterium]
MLQRELPADLQHRIDSYLQQEPLQEYRLFIQKLVEQAQSGHLPALQQLQHRFEPLQFGTAGLRAAMAAGEGCINHVTVCRVAWALGQHLLHGYDTQQLAKQGVVIGHDARHNSLDFAEAMAAVLTGLGVAVHLFDVAVPTPVCAFTTVALRALGAAMVTASHNPATDNGVKIYRSDGAQMMENDSVPIAQLMQQAPSVSTMVCLSQQQQRQLGLRHVVEQKTIDAYFAAITALPVYHNHQQQPKRIKVVHTPLHGVARDWAVRALHEAGFDRVHVVPQQADPNPQFPTTPYPNPQDPHALQLAIKQAQQLSADLLLANDPDADRLAVCVPNAATGAWEMLDGNAIGVLLADWILSCCQRSSGVKPLVVTTVVSSRLLSCIAQHYGASYAESLTGFRHIAQTVRQHHAAHHHQQFVFGYEEALGYCLSPTLVEKDGICAAAAFARLFVQLQQQGKTVQQQLDELALQHGLHHTHQFSLAFAGATGAQRMAEVMVYLRSNPQLLPHGAGWQQQQVMFCDLLQGDGNFPKANVLVWQVAQQGRIVARPSGTEPKMKFYVELTQRVDTLKQLQQTRQQLQQRCEQIQADITQLLLTHAA